MNLVWGRISTLECNWNLLWAALGWPHASIIVIAVLFKRSTNFRNDEWLKTFGVTVRAIMLNVPGRILQTPGIIYGKVGVSSLDISSVIYAILIGYDY